MLTGHGCADPGVEPHDSRVVWSAPTRSDRDPSGTPSTDGTRLFAILQGVSAYNVSDGSLAWRVPLEQYAPRNLPIWNGRIYAAEASVRALDAASGQTIWSFRPDENASLGEAAVHDGGLYFGTSSHRVYALTASGGQLLWSTDVGPEWPYTAVVRGVSVAGDTVYAAVEQWRAENGYIASAWIVALDRTTGSVLWRFQSGHGEERHAVSAAPVIAGRLLIASDHSSNAVFAIDRFTGAEVWRMRGESGYVGFLSAPVVRGGTVLAASGDTHVYAAELATGRVLWRSAMPGAAQFAALCGNRLFVNYFGIAVLDVETGHVLWSGRDEDDEFAVSGFAVANDRAYVLGNRSLYALRCN